MRKNDADRITDDEMHDALKRSGYLLEWRAARVLQQQGWECYPNYAYVDNKKSTTRELDLLAVKKIDIPYGQRPGSVTTIIIAEAINNPQPFAMIDPTLPEEGGSRNRPVELGVIPYAIRVSGNIASLCASPGTPSPVLPLAGAEKWHHYCTERSCTQYCSFSKKLSGQAKGQWFASHDEAHFGCIEGLEQSLTDVKEHVFCSFSDEVPQLNLFVPALILGGDLCHVYCGNEDPEIQPQGRGLLKKNTITSDADGDRQNTVFFIDVVCESDIEQWSRVIDAEVEKLVEFLQRNSDALGWSLDHWNKVSL